MPSSRWSSRRAAVPIARIICPPLPIRMPFCDSVSTQTRAFTIVRSARGRLDVLDLDLDGVRNLLEGAPQHLLAHELGEHDPLRLVRAVLDREEERAFGDERPEVLDERGDALPRPRGDREDVIADAERLGLEQRLRRSRAGAAGRPC